MLVTALSTVYQWFPLGIHLRFESSNLKNYRRKPEGTGGEMSDRHAGYVAEGIGRESQQTGPSKCTEATHTSTGVILTSTAKHISW